MTTLSLSRLTKRYGSRSGGASCLALDEVSFDVEEGEFLGIMGPSGAGKTTLLNIVATIDSPTSGSVSIGGTDPFAFSPDALAEFRRTRLGFVFQDCNLLDTMTLRENIALPLALGRMKAAAIEERIAAAASDLGISAVLDKYPWEVSGGQKQRAACARAIVTAPALLLADEPTGALDSKSGRDLLSCFALLNEERRATILLVTHDPFAASWCKRILFLKDGKTFTELVRSGERREFFERILEVLSVMGGNGDDAR